MHQLSKTEPFVLDQPEKLSADRVMQRAIPLVLDRVAPTVPSPLLLNLLERRLAQLKPDSRSSADKAKTYLPAFGSKNRVSKDFGKTQEDLADLIDAFNYAVRQRRHVCKTATAESKAGYFLLALMLRSRLCGENTLAAALRKLAEKPHAESGSGWAWMDVVVDANSHASTHVRRIFVDPTTLSLWAIAARKAADLPEPQGSTRHRNPKKHFRRLVKRCVGAALNDIFGSGSRSPRGWTVNRICKAVAEWVHINTCPILATYAAGELGCTSLTLDTWLRLIGCHFSEPTPTDARAAPDLDQTRHSTSDASGQTEDDWLDAALSGELDEGGFIGELNRVMRAPMDEWDSGLTKLLRSSQKGGKARLRTEVLIVRWIQWLASGRADSQNPLRAGTIRLYKGQLANRILQAFPDDLSGIDEDSLTSIYEAVGEATTSPQNKDRVLGTLRQFHQFVRQELGLDLPDVQIEGFSAGGYAVSARIVTHAEADAVLFELESGERTRKLNANDSLNARALVILAFFRSLRFQEAVGSQRRDSRGHEFVVRDNHVRTTKTRNGVRRLPLLDLDERYQVLLREHSEIAATAAGFPFCKGKTEPSEKSVKEHRCRQDLKVALNKIVGDPHLHPHNLRHSFGSLTEFGALTEILRWRKLSVHDHPFFSDWMADASTRAAALMPEIKSPLQGDGSVCAAISMMMGHASESTTFQHYIHTMDLVLFLACDQTFERVDLADKQRHPRFAAGEAALLTAAMGLCPTTRVQTDDLEALHKRIGALSGGRMINHESVRDSRYDPAFTSRPLEHLTLEGLRATDSGASAETAYDQRGEPTGQAQIDCAQSMLDLVRDASSAEVESRVRMLDTLAAGLRKNSDLSSMKINEANDWLASFESAFGETVQVDLKHVFTPNRERNKVRETISPKDLRRLAKKGAPGVVWLRIRDPRPGAAPERSRLQSTVTWCLKRLPSYARAELRKLGQADMFV